MEIKNKLIEWIEEAKKEDKRIVVKTSVLNGIGYADDDKLYFDFGAVKLSHYDDELNYKVNSHFLCVTAIYKTGLGNEGKKMFLDEKKLWTREIC